MRKLAGKLNSNESFRPNQHFQVDLTLVRPMGTGSGRVKDLSSGRMGVPMSRNLKTSIVEIRNQDESCCARAIVTLKARAEWEIVKRKVKVEAADTRCASHTKERNAPEQPGALSRIPPKSYYDPDGMKTKDKAAFEKWYDEQVNRGELFGEAADTRWSNS